MNILIAAILTVVVASADCQVRTFTYPAESTAAYPPGTGLIYSAGTKLKHPAGTVAIYLSPLTAIQFPEDTEFYVSKGPVTVVAGTIYNFTSNSQVSYGPGTSLMVVSNNAEIRYGQFNGNTHTIVQYPERTDAKYYTGSNTNLILFQAGTNPLQYYNPGGSTQFGASALPVESEITPTARTYGYYGGGGGYSYCSGYNYGGWPQTTYYNYNSGYRSTCQQTGYGTYSYPSNNYGGGYSMAGGSCYGGRNYYSGGGGGSGGGYGRK